MHTQTDTQKDEGVKYPYGQCGKQFSQKGHLAENRRAIHEGVKYPCGQCDKQFNLIILIHSTLFDLLKKKGYNLMIWLT